MILFCTSVVIVFIVIYILHNRFCH